MDDPYPRTARARWRAGPALLLGLALAFPAGAGTDPAGAAVAAAAEPAPARPRTCLVLSGGGARGAAHIGVLKVLEELRVPIDCVVGTSMGAIVGAAYAAGLAPEGIERFVREADWARLLSDQPPRAERSVYAKELERARVGGAEVGLRDGGIVLPAGILVGHSLQFFLQDLVRTARVEDFDRLAIPFRAVATDFETGAMVVIGRGDLANAMRASMSVPGAFAPVERDGRVLVDGGLVRNLPVDVARELGAEVVIAVNLGTPLLPRDRLGSLVAAAEQTVSILTEQNVRASLAQLGPGDVLVAPELGDLGAADFTRAIAAIPAGEAAARQVADRLRALAIDAPAYARWQAAQRADPAPRTYARLRVDGSGLRYVTPRAVDALLLETYGPERVERGMAQLLGWDDFQRVEARAEATPEGTTLVLRPLEKSWGPQYLRFGLALDADLEGDSGFTAALDHRATWLNRRGMEWRNRASVGDVNAFGSELRQPLDMARRWFAALRGDFLQEERTLFLQEDAVATYRNRRLTARFDLGRRLSNYGEITLGVESGSVAAILATGSPSIFQDVRRQTAALRAAFVADRLDDLDFPQTGHLIAVDARLTRNAFGGEDRYERVEVRAQQAFGSGPRSLLLGVRHGTSFGTDLPPYDPFTAGGFLDLSGRPRDAILASRLTVASAVYRHRIGGGSNLLPGLYVGASLEHASVGRQLNGFGNDHVFGGSVFLSAESLLGPFYLGAGYGEGGNAALYLYVGRP